MRNLLFILSIVVLCACSETQSNKVANIEYSVEKGLSDFKACRAVNKKNDCQDITAKAICGHFHITDFITQDDKGNQSFTAVHKIGEAIEKHPKWIKVGMADDRAVVDKVLKHIKDGVPALGLSRGESYRHVAILLKGETTSGKWGGKVPVCASYFQNNPKGSFIDKGMNYAWKDPAKVEMWVRL